MSSYLNNVEILAKIEAVRVLIAGLDLGDNTTALGDLTTAIGTLNTSVGDLKTSVDALKTSIDNMSP